jgi:hypothetical protein
MFRCLADQEITMAKDIIRMGIAGACARGGSFEAACEAHERLPKG